VANMIAVIDGAPWLIDWLGDNLDMLNVKNEHCILGVCPFRRSLANRRRGVIPCQSSSDEFSRL